VNVYDAFPICHPMFRSISHALAAFDGSDQADVDSWIIHFQNMTRMFTDEERFYLLSEKLIDRAGTWFRDQQRACPMPANTPIAFWLTKLQQHFAMSFSMRKAAVLTRKQKKDESPQAFCTDLRHLLMIYNPQLSDQEKVDWLQRQIYPDYRSAFALYHRANDTWQQAVEALAAAMEYTAQFGSKTSPHSSQSLTHLTGPVHAPEPIQGQCEKILKDLDDKVKSLSLYEQRQVRFKDRNERGRDRERSRERGRARDHSDDRNSGYKSDSRQSSRERGRSPEYRRSRERSSTPAFRRQSNERDRNRSRERSQSPGRNPIKCWNCGGLGHTSDKCPSARGINNSNNNSQRPRSQGN
jgi:hypothetical protein